MAPRSATEVVALENLLRTQWLRLRAWIDRYDLATGTGESVLPGWSIAELVAHLDRAMAGLAQAQPAPAGTVPLTLAEYVGSYPDRAEEVAAATRALAQEIADEPLSRVERTAEAAFAKLAVLRDLGADPVVQAPRGPVLLSTMLVSRLLELVVHADDLTRSAHLPPADPGPIEPAALDAVAEALCAILVERGGWSVEVADELAWVRLACGRVPLDATTMTAALRPTHTGDSLPDLGRTLPLL